jgi:hypothetical protein
MIGKPGQEEGMPRRPLSLAKPLADDAPLWIRLTLRPLERGFPIPDYRRYHVPGGCYFFTVNLVERRGNDLLTRHINRLRNPVRTVLCTRPFATDAWVMLPDHLHCVWTLPPGDGDFSDRRQLINA